MTQARKLKAREVEIYVGSDGQNIILSEVNKFDVSYNNQVGTKVGLNKNFIKAWKLGVTTISISGHSYIGAFIPEKGIDRIDGDVKTISKDFEKFIDANVEQKSSLWLHNSSEKSKHFIGYISDFSYNETSQNPFYISYDITFKCMTPAELKLLVKEEAKVDIADYYLSNESIAKERKRTMDEAAIKDEKRAVVNAITFSREQAMKQKALEGRDQQFLEQRALEGREPSEGETILL